MNYIETIREQGFVVIENLMPPALMATIRADLAPYLQSKLMGRNDFEGFQTERVYALLAKSAAIATLVEDPEILAIADAFLPANYLLSSALAINVHPGETPQRFHVDDSGNAFPIPLPRAMLGLSTIWAFDDFTSTNGATEVIAGSHQWSEMTPPDQIDGSTGTKVEMAAGSVVVFAGNLVHRGGANQSANARLGLTIQYCNPHMRQLENMPLIVPPQNARVFSQRVQGLLGYSLVSPGFKGHVDGRHPKLLVDRNYVGRKQSGDLPS